jgi:hypothetical protein
MLLEGRQRGPDDSRTDGLAVDHSAGNYRSLMIMGGDLLAYGMAHDIAQLDEKCYLEVFQPRHPRSTFKKKVKV